MDNGIYITSKKEIKFALGDLESGATVNIYSVDEEGAETLFSTTTTSEFNLDGVTPELSYNQTYKLIARQTNSREITSESSNPIYFTYRYLDYSTISDFDENILRYYKCYRLIHRIPPSYEDLYGSGGIKEQLDALSSIEDKREFVANECISELNTASLSDSGSGYILTDQTDETQLRILKNINDFHISMLKETNPYATFMNRGAIDVHENAEAALRMTKAILANENWSTVLEGDTPSKVLEVGPYVPTNVNAYGAPSFSLDIEEDEDGDIWRSSKSLYREHDLILESTSLLNLASSDETLEVIGAYAMPWMPDITLDNYFNQNPNRYFTIIGDGGTWDDIKSSYNTSLIDDAGDCAPGSSGFYLELGELTGIKNASDCTISNFRGGSTNIKKHAGGGAIGSIGYLLNNSNGLELAGEGSEIYHVESNTFHRRWARHVMEDFMCRNFPTFSSSDAVPVCRLCFRDLP